MDIQCESILRKLYSQAKETKDFYVICCDIGLRGDERKEACLKLQKEDYIAKYKAIGKTSVQCQVTEKAIQYFENKTMEEEK